MRNLAISTMPIKPRKKPCIGMCIAPVIKEVLSCEMNANGILALNTLHSYDNVNDYLNQTLEYFRNKHLDLSNILIDEKYKDLLLNIIEKLYFDGILIVKDSHKYRCDCGRVDIDENGIRNYDDGNLYKFDNGKIVCKYCLKECSYTSEKSLFLHLNEHVDDTVDIFPFFLNKEMKYLSKQLKGKDILISKKRNTGVYITVEGHRFNIDVDFLWMNISKCINEENQIFIASNHQLYEMFIMNYLNKLIGEKKLSFIATPYLDSCDNFDPELSLTQIDEEYFVKLCLLYMLKWKKKNCRWDPSIIKGVFNLSAEKRQEIWFHLCNYGLEDLELMEEINQMLNYKINLDKNFKYVKKLKR